MSNLSQFLASGGGGKLRYQEFTTSGTFTPQAKLIANGGWVFLEMAGGGGAGSGVGYPGGDGGTTSFGSTQVIGGFGSTSLGGGAAGGMGMPGGMGNQSSQIGGMGGGFGGGGSSSPDGSANTGGGGAGSSGVYTGGGGGSSYMQKAVQVTGEVSVVIGAGGTRTGFATSGNGGSGFVRVYWTE